MLWSALLFIITISILVTVHEFGHFSIARLCGVRVECFSIGFGKKLWSHKFSSGTEFVIAMIPLGGYVKMLDSRAKQLTADEEKFAFDHKKIWQRAAIIAAGPIANFILACLVYWIIFQIGVITYPVKIERILPNTPVATVKIPLDAELITFNGIQVESWNDVNFALISVMGEKEVTFSYVTHSLKSDPNKEIYTTVDISHWRSDIENGQAIKSFGFIPSRGIITVSKVESESAAERAGLQIGDEIIKINNNFHLNLNDFIAMIKKASVMTLTIKRSNQIINVDLIPSVDVNGEGRAGLYLYSKIDIVIKQYGIIDAFGKGFEQTILKTKVTVGSFYQLVTGVIGLKNLSGPISIAKSAGYTADNGIVSFLEFLALISISLGVINLVPLPMLDGGHLLFLVLEKIKGKPLSETTQAIFYRLGFVLLMIIMGIALFNDFLRL